jgi:hypothetical protein
MAECCPAGRGCNAPDGAEPCALSLCRAAAADEPDAALAVARWQALEASPEGDGERRFRRRAFERARDQALITLAMRPARTRASRRRAPLRRRQAGAVSNPPRRRASVAESRRSSS